MKHIFSARIRLYGGRIEVLRMTRKLLVFHSLRSSNCCRLRVITRFHCSKIRPEMDTGRPYAAPPSGITMTNRYAATGFLLVLWTMRSLKHCRSRVIIDFQPNCITPRVVMVFMRRHLAKI
jgi:hypothetical protein